jgi:hypothetical protein
VLGFASFQVMSDMIACRRWHDDMAWHQMGSASSTAGGLCEGGGGMMSPCQEKERCTASHTIWHHVAMYHQAGLQALKDRLSNAKTLSARPRHEL